LSSPSDDPGAAETEIPSEPSSVGPERQEALFQEIAEELAEREALLATTAEAPEPAPEGPSAVEMVRETREAINQLGEQINQRLAGLQAQFDREVRAEATRERIVDRLHAELQEYKQDLLLRIQRPIFIDLIQLHDDIGKMTRSTTAPGGDGEADERGAAFRCTLESIQVAIEDVLYRQGVEPFRGEGEAFDPRRQRALTTVPTDREDLAKTIAERLRPGFQAGDKIIRPELVSVYTLAR